MINILQNPIIIVSIIGALVSLVTLLLNILVSIRTQHLARFLEVTGGLLNFKKQQVDEFYGPLLALTMQNKSLAYRLKDVKSEDFELLDNLPEILQEPGVSSIVGLLLKNDTEIEKLLLTKSSLIEGENYPSSVTRFLGHCGILKSAVSSQPLETRKREDYYPDEFDAYIQEQFEKAKQEINEILKERSRLFYRSK